MSPNPTTRPLSSRGRKDDRERMGKMQGGKLQKMREMKNRHQNRRQDRCQDSHPGHHPGRQRGHHLEDRPDRGQGTRHMRPLKGLDRRHAAATGMDHRLVV